MKIVIKTSDGGVAIMTLIGNADANECIEKWKAVNPGKYVSHREMTDGAIPTDRTFRDAWCDVTPEAVIDIDPAKVKQIKRGGIVAQIEAIEVESKLNRGQRETEIYENLPFHAERIAARESAASGITITAEAVLAQNIYYNKIKALDEQIAKLRSELLALS